MGYCGPAPLSGLPRGAEGQAQWARRNSSVFTNNDASRRQEMVGPKLTLKGLLRSGSANGLLSKSDISLALGVTHPTQALRERRGEAAAPLRAHVAAAEQIRVQLAGHPAGRATEHARCGGLPAAAPLAFAVPFLQVRIARSGLWLRPSRELGRRNRELRADEKRPARHEPAGFSESMGRFPSALSRRPAASGPARSSEDQFQISSPGPSVT
ncbi:PREDICTED: uncharacterized protein LOC105596141 [Cercocebus atys]|uniref:uncharacterized protein LOC105596141 n=1 Tax=Cercocebus atys TaxID=9531 RepID=UPI0005F49974|nr:PREDICTED: uncharacterized protein LOC105596141 [Cercocebus atys]